MDTDDRRVVDLQLVGNAVCLDFANTISTRLEAGHDYLQTYPDVVAWAVHAGVVRQDDVSVLLALSEGDAALRQAVALREHVHVAFTTLANRHDIPGDALDGLGRAFFDALSSAQVGYVDGAARAHWPPESAVTPLPPIAWSAVKLLTSGPLDRVRACPGCGWLYLDTSRGGRRQWCDMQTCGARHKMRAYRQRLGEEARGG